MTWSVDQNIQVQNLITVIAGRLTASGWTLTDREADQVWHSTNSQGVTQYLQLSLVGAYTYLQAQGWQAWDINTHTGANGSSLNNLRVYVGATAVPGNTLCNLYMSVNANRVILMVETIGAIRSFLYFGGLHTGLAGVSQPNCVYAVSNYTASGGSPSSGLIQQSAGASSYWALAYVYSYISLPTYDSLTPYPLIMQTVFLATEIGKVFLPPLLVVDAYVVRGYLDGMAFAPLGGGVLSHGDTLEIDGTTYFIFQPGGSPGTNTHPFTLNYTHALAIAEV